MLSRKKYDASNPLKFDPKNYRANFWVKLENFQMTQNVLIRTDFCSTFTITRDIDEFMNLTDYYYYYYYLLLLLLLLSVKSNTLRSGWVTYNVSLNNAENLVMRKLFGSRHDPTPTGIFWTRTDWESAADPRSEGDDRPHGYTGKMQGRNHSGSGVRIPKIWKDHPTF